MARATGRFSSRPIGHLPFPAQAFPMDRKSCKPLVWITHSLSVPSASRQQGIHMKEERRAKMPASLRRRQLMGLAHACTHEPKSHTRLLMAWQQIDLNTIAPITAPVQADLGVGQVDLGADITDHPRDGGSFWSDHEAGRRSVGYSKRTRG